MKSELEQAFIFGQEAEKVVKNPAYVFASTAIRGEIVNKLANVQILGNNEEVIELVRTLQNMDALQSQLESIMAEGTFAEENLRDQNENPNRYNRC